MDYVAAAVVAALVAVFVGTISMGEKTDPEAHQEPVETYQKIICMPPANGAMSCVLKEQSITKKQAAAFLAQGQPA